MRLRLIKYFLIIILAVSYLLVTVYHKSEYLQVDYLNIGQGDSILMQTTSGLRILIDGGPGNQLLAELGEVLPWWERHIDYLIISHYHADHIEGLIELIEHYQIGEILTTEHLPQDDLLFQIWQQKIIFNNIKVNRVQMGDVWRGDENLTWQILSADASHEDYNDNSLVVRFSYGDIDYLFTGDLTSVKEADLIRDNLPESSEVLKVAHHGSKYSSSADWLAAIQPQLCIIQSGKDNKFGHPHQEALDRLNRQGCTVWRNDLSGRITVFSDGKAWWLKDDKHLLSKQFSPIIKALKQ